MSTPTADVIDQALRERLTRLRDHIVCGIDDAGKEGHGFAVLLDAVQVNGILSAILADHASYNGTTAANAFAHAELRARRVAAHEQNTVTTILGFEWDAAPMIYNVAASSTKDTSITDPFGEVTVKHTRADDHVLYLDKNPNLLYRWTHDITHAMRFDDAVSARAYAKTVHGVGVSIAIEIVSLLPANVLTLWADGEWQQCFMHCRPTEGLIHALGDPAFLNKPATLLDVVEVIATDVHPCDGEWTGYEGVFKLRDGRYLFVNARRRNDGWLRNAGHRLTATTLRDIDNALSQGERKHMKDPIRRAVTAELASYAF